MERGLFQRDQLPLACKKLVLPDGYGTHLNPSTRETEAGGSLQVLASLVYRASSRTCPRATQRYSVLKEQKQESVW